MRLLAFSGFPSHGGSLEALVAYQPDPAMLATAAGRPLCLAAHIGVPGGEPVVWEGPRSRAVDAIAVREQEVAVPLAVPPQVGAYSVEIEPVVDGVAWGATLGLPGLPLGLERLADGSVLLTDPSDGQSYRVPANPAFTIPVGRYGQAASERCVEVPWALTQYAGERRVLDVGYANAEPAHLEALRALDIPLLVGLDIAGRAVVGVAGVLGDVRHAPFRARSFDLIYAISVIEHIGRDNSRYEEGFAGGVAGVEGDLVAIRELATLLHPRGRLLLTVPYGDAEDLGWMVQYDAARLERLVHSSGLAAVKIEHYHYDYDNGWEGPVDPAALTRHSYRQAEFSAAAVACVTLQHAPVASVSRGIGALVQRAGSALRAALHQASAIGGTLGMSWHGLWQRPACRWSG